MIVVRRRTAGRRLDDELVGRDRQLRAHRIGLGRGESRAARARRVDDRRARRRLRLETRRRCRRVRPGASVKRASSA